MYMLLKNTNTEMNAYSTSRVAVKAIRNIDRNLTTLNSNILETFSGSLKALCANNPWYNMRSESNIGCVLIKVSVLLLKGPKNVETLFININ